MYLNDVDVCDFLIMFYIFGVQKLDLIQFIFNVVIILIIFKNFKLSKNSIELF